MNLFCIKNVFRGGLFVDTVQCMHIVSMNSILSGPSPEIQTQFYHSLLVYTAICLETYWYLGIKVNLVVKINAKRK